MEDLNQVEAAAKADVQKVETEAQAFDASAARARRRAMDLLNEEKDWVDRHPALAGVIVILALAGCVALGFYALLR